MTLVGLIRHLDVRRSSIEDLATNTGGPKGRRFCGPPIVVFRLCDEARSRSTCDHMPSAPAATGKTKRHLLQWLVASIVLLCGRELFAAQTSSPEPFIVTAYCQQGITKSGIRATPGVAAADPDFVPLGSVVGVATPPSTDLSIYTVVDTGAKVKGRVLDLFTPDCGRAKQFGRRLLRVTILRFGWHAQRLVPRAASPGDKP